MMDNLNAQPAIVDPQDLESESAGTIKWSKSSVETFSLLSSFAPISKSRFLSGIMERI